MQTDDTADSRFPSFMQVYDGLPPVRSLCYGPVLPFIETVMAPFREPFTRGRILTTNVTKFGGVEERWDEGR